MSAAYLAIARHTAWVLRDEVVYAAPLPDGPPFVLAGPGAEIWCALAGGGTLDEVAARVAEAVGSPAEALAPDVTAFVSGLVDAGLVTRGVASSSPMPAQE